MNIWKFIHLKLAQKIDLMLMVVVESSGSSPGRPGFKMAVSVKKELYGSIGGGKMEYQMVELAYSSINQSGALPFLKKQIHHDDKNENSSGSICSGSQTILFFPLAQANLSTIDQIRVAIKSSIKGIISISNHQFKFLPENTIENKIQFKSISENEWEYLEKPSKANKICIIGAGHVGLALSKIMKGLDFIVEIYDDRLGLNTFENNAYVNKKLKINYTGIDKLLPEGDNVYVVIMTFGHQSDELVLGKILDMNFKYIGMMGSKSKVDKIYKSLGYNPENEKGSKVFAPIGISIHSQTPAEIAISIAAEIIKIKNTCN